ncbi:phage tail protein [Pseudomonas allii]|uniref:Phage tail protein n=1 Tax=Pseudomonas allii TaxID=2740531 RepID=A0ACC6LDP2_9PSED|nr:phage tail protein [Pseudomonas allii]MDR9876570.1 phage tail protein [Pseudomonas allii]
MTDQNSQFFAILTAVGEAKQANAAALGTSWTFAQMGVGDANGTDPIPSRTQTKLINERRRAPLNQVKVDPTNASVIIAEQIIPENVGGWWVRELALYDADGDMVAVANCAPTFKPLLSQGSGRTQVIRINLIVSSTSNIELKIDPSVVLATREYVDTSVIEALARLDFKHSVLVATTANIALSGIQTIDGVLLTADARVLVKDQVQAKDNGIYVVPASGAWKRAQDADTSIEVTPGLFVHVEKGTASGDSVWQLVTDAPIVLGTTPLDFEMVAGRTGVVAGTYRSLTVDKNGRVIAGTNPTTLAGAGITDGMPKNGGPFYPKFSGLSFNVEVAGYSELGGYIGWGSSGTGTVQFICNKGGGSTGGFVWGTVAADNQALGPLMSYSADGILNVPTALYVPAITSNTTVSTQSPGYAGPYIANCAFVSSAVSVKISGDRCPSAGFAGGGYGAPYMAHTDGKVVYLRPASLVDTALLAPTGWSKNADTGEIVQWLEYNLGDLGNATLVNVTWPFQFPNQFLNARISFRLPPGVACATQGSFSEVTAKGCTLRIEEWAGAIQTGLVLMVEARGF